MHVAYACETMQQIPYVPKTFLWAVMDFRDSYTEQKINAPQLNIFSNFYRKPPPSTKFSVMKIRDKS